MRLLPLVPALLLTAPLALAVEHDAELRLTIGAAPGITQTDQTESTSPAGAPVPGANGKYSYDAKAGFYVEPSIMWHTSGNGFGLVGGPLAFFSAVTGTRASGAEKRKLTSYGLGAEFGPSLQLDWFRLEFLGYLAGGFAHAKATKSSGTITNQLNSQEGWCLDYGLRGGMYAASDQGVIGLQLGYQLFTAHVNFPSHQFPANTFNSDSETITGDGVFLAFVAGVAF